MRPNQLLIATISVCIVITGAGVRVKSARNKEAASICEKSIRLIQGAKRQWALESGNGPDAKPTWDDICWYTGVNSTNECPLRCPFGGTYTIGKVDEFPICSYHGLSVYVAERSLDQNAVTGALVETFSSVGVKKTEAHTGAYGCAFLKIPPNQAGTVIVSKPGFLPSSNPIQSLATNPFVALERAPK